MHFDYPPKFCINIVFDFSRDHWIPRRNWCIKQGALWTRWIRSYSFSFTDEMVQDFFFTPDWTPGLLLPRCVIPPDSCGENTRRASRLQTSTVCYNRQSCDKQRSSVWLWMSVWFHLLSNTWNRWLLLLSLYPCRMLWLQFLLSCWHQMHGYGPVWRAWSARKKTG